MTFQEVRALPEFFIEQVEKGGSNEAIGQLLKSYEINPKEHFQKIKSYLVICFRKHNCRCIKTRS